MRIVEPVNRVGGELSLPSDKSISHRLLIFSAISKNPSKIIIHRMGEDVKTTRNILLSLGINIGQNGGEFTIYPNKISSPVAPLNMGNSGTTTRLITGLLSAIPGFFASLYGDESLSWRPMKRVILPLEDAGAHICARDDKVGIVKGYADAAEETLASTSMTINAPATVLLAMYIAVAEKQGVPQEKLGGTVQNDILKEYAARGMYIFPPKPSMKLVTDIFEYCSKHMPRWNTISISGYHIREAGSTAVQEVAFTLANAIAYVQAAIDRGLDLDKFASRLSFFFAAHNNFFEEIAKFRAARRLWAKIMRERFGAKNPASWRLRFHTQTSGCTLTAQQPLNNIVRVTLQALAAVLGGTQSLHTNSFDEALALPSELAVRVALRTQQIIAYESGVADTIDPLGGSYYVEWLTNEMEERAWEYIHKIEDMGGVIEAIEKGWLQQEIANSAYKYQREVDMKKRIIVGVNEYTTEEHEEVPLLRIDPKVEEEQIARLQKVKRERDNQKVRQILQKLHDEAEKNVNLMPTIIEAVKAYATLGEICDVLREVYGVYKEMIII